MKKLVYNVIELFDDNSIMSWTFTNKKDAELWLEKMVEHEKEYELHYEELTINEDKKEAYRFWIDEAYMITDEDVEKSINNVKWDWEEN